MRAAERQHDPDAAHGDDEAEQSQPPEPQIREQLIPDVGTDTRKVPTALDAGLVPQDAGDTAERVEQLVALLEVGADELRVGAALVGDLH